MFSYSTSNWLRSGWPSFLLIAVVSTFTTSCETTVDADITTYEPRLALYGFPNPDSAWSILLYRTAAPYELVTEEQLRVSDAHIVVSGKRGRNVLQVAALGHYIHVSWPLAGEEFLLGAEASGYPPIRAQGHVPERPQVDTTSLVSLGREGNEFLYRIVLTLDDPAGVNFYRLGLYERSADLESYWRTIKFESTDPALRPSPDLVGALSLDELASGYRIAWFGDEQFEGDRRTIELDIRFFHDVPDSAVLVLSSMSEDYFEYHRTLEQQSISFNDVLAAPTEVFSNVENGVGIVGGYANSVVEVRFDN